VFVTVVPTWHVGDEFLITHDRRLRILAIDADIPDAIAETGINAIWTVEPRLVLFSSSAVAMTSWKQRERLSGRIWAASFPTA
jgi:hypothetical protein